MSATNRGGERVALDQYMTHQWIIESLLKSDTNLPFDSSLPWLEPCVGTGNIIKTLPPNLDWEALDIDEKFYPDLTGDFSRDGRTVHLLSPADFLTTNFGDKQYACVMTNPPYDIAFDIVLKSLWLAPHVVMLLRLNWAGSIERHDFLEETTPDLKIITPRPKFKRVGTDATEYAWFHWYPGSTGKVTWLELGPKKSKKEPRKVELPDIYRRVS